MAHRVAPRAETDLDDIWLYVAKESGSIEIANRLIDTVTDRFTRLPAFPTSGVPARMILAPDVAAWRWGNMSSSIVSKIRTRLSSVLCMAAAT
jgi:plasmid stabilization system protein ParE